MLAAVLVVSAVVAVTLPKQQQQSTPGLQGPDHGKGLKPVPPLTSLIGRDHRYLRIVEQGLGGTARITSAGYPDIGYCNSAFGDKEITEKYPVTDCVDLVVQVNSRMQVTVGQTCAPPVGTGCSPGSTRFLGWGGACKGANGDTCIVQMDDDQTVLIRFQYYECLLGSAGTPTWSTSPLASDRDRRCIAQTTTATPGAPPSNPLSPPDSLPLRPF